MKHLWILSGLIFLQHTGLIITKAAGYVDVAVSMAARCASDAPADVPAISLNSHSQPADAAASPNTRALLSYLNELQYQGDSGRVLSGTTLCKQLDRSYSIYVEGTFEKTGVYPAIIHPLICDHAADRSDPYFARVCHRSSSWIIPGSYNWAKDGGLVWWLYNPSKLRYNHINP